MTPLLFAVSSAVLIGLGSVIVLLAVAVVLWQVLGRGPRRHRIYKQAQHALHGGYWAQALAGAREILQLGRLSPLWEGRVRNLQGESHHVAGDACLKEKQYEDALRHYTVAAEFLNLDASEFRTKVVEVMLGEVLRLFAAGPSHNEATQQLVGRILHIDGSSAVARFWQGLCHIRDNRLDLAAAALQSAHEAGGKTFIDAPLYLGMVQLCQDRPQDALRSLADANRIHSTCPFVPLHMGLALVAAGGDSSLAVRALDRALGSRGLTPWEKTPQKAWVEGLPEHSHVRRLAAKYPYTCPILGSELTPVLLKARFALGQAHYRLGRFQEAVDVFTRLLQDAPPTPLILRSLGLVLSKLERYDQAYKQLRIALDQDPKDHLTAGYLALCGALGKPTQTEDKPRNIAWAVRQLTRYEVYGDPEWAKIGSRVLAEARNLEVPIAVEDQVRLCDVLASVFATDAEAAAAYDHLALTAPEGLRPEHAWIYCQAAHQHGLAGKCDLDLFARTLREADQARPFYQQRGWDFEAVEYGYLERVAKARPGCFPEELGLEYAARGTTLLLERSRRLEESGDRDGALAAADVLLRLAPTTTLAHDRLARLYHARSDLDRAAALLSGWHRLEPSNPVPLVRRAIIEQQRGNAAGRTEAIRLALDCTQGRSRTGIAFLGARLALASAPVPPVNGQAGEGFGEAEELLQECLREEPGHADALWVLAALRALTGDRSGLAALAAPMNRPAEPNPHFHYMAAVCLLAAGDAIQALEACRRAWGDPALLVECRYLMGWAHLQLGDETGAAREWEIVARTPDSPSGPCARALLGRLRFGQGNWDDAVALWGEIDPAQRARWGLEEPLRSTVFLSGLLALEESRFDQAADRFRQAGKLGLRDRRLGPLLFLALVRAGQQRLYQEEVVEDRGSRIEDRGSRIEKTGRDPRCGRVS
jgi:tetratricopeptide (TPR) repeat protein